MDALWGQAVKAAKKLNEADKELFMKRFHAELAQLDASKEKLEYSWHQMIFNPDKRLSEHSLPSIIYLNDVHQGQEKDLS